METSFRETTDALQTSSNTSFPTASSPSEPRPPASELVVGFQPILHPLIDPWRLRRIVPNGREKTLVPAVFSWLVALVRRNPFLSAFAISIILAGGVAGIVSWSYNRDAQLAYMQIPPNGSGVALLGHGYHFDATAQILSIEWEIAGCGAYRLTTYPPTIDIYNALGCDSLDRAVDIYFNAALEPTYSYDPARFPLTPTNERQYVYALNAFDVQHVVDSFATGPTPFDVYVLTLFAFVVERATNRSVPIITFAVGEAPDNFVISSVETMRTKNNYTYDTRVGPATVEVESSMIDVEVKRSQLARAFTLCLLIVNWALTVGSTYVTLLAVFREGDVNEAVLLFPVTIVLTIPALRNLYVGSPPFGIYIDTLGFFLQMMTVAVCSMVLVCVVAIPKSVPKR